MSSFRLDPAKTALVAVDLQKGVMGISTVPHSSAEVVRKSGVLAKHFREKGALVVYVRIDMSDFLQLPVDLPPRDPNAPPPAASELVPETGFQSGDLIITKRDWGAFAGTELEQALKKRGIDTIVLTGVATNVGVESTARQGTGLGFAFVIVEDACGARDAEDHRLAFERTFPRLARVRKTDEVIAALG